MQLLPGQKYASSETMLPKFQVPKKLYVFHVFPNYMETSYLICNTRFSMVCKKTKDMKFHKKSTQID